MISGAQQAVESASAPWRRGVALWHNLNPGTIDLYVPLRTWIGEALQVWLGNLPAGQQPPSGWSVTRAAPPSFALHRFSGS